MRQAMMVLALLWGMPLWAQQEPGLHLELERLQVFETEDDILRGDVDELWLGLVWFDAEDDPQLLMLPAADARDALVVSDDVGSSDQPLGWSLLDTPLPDGGFVDGMLLLFECDHLEPIGEQVAPPANHEQVLRGMLDRWSALRVAVGEPLGYPRRLGEGTVERYEVGFRDGFRDLLRELRRDSPTDGSWDQLIGISAFHIRQRFGVPEVRWFDTGTTLREGASALMGTRHGVTGLGMGAGPNRALYMLSLRSWLE